MKSTISSRLASLAKPSTTATSPCQKRSFASTSQNLATYGFIGLGRMGYPMAKNLRARIDASDVLLIHDRNTEATSKFVQEVGIASSSAGAGEKGMNIEIASSAREVAERSQAIISALPDASHVNNVFHSILSRKLPPLESTDPNVTERLFVECSTIDPATSREIANAVHSTQQGRFVDAPMSGGVVGANAGSLTFMLGAHSKHGGLIKFRIRPLLEKMGAKVLHLGGQGAGLAGKLANNYLLAVSNIATAEAMSLGQASGVDAQKLAELINGASGRCWSSEINNPVPGISPSAPAENDYEPGFAIELMKKDLGLAIDEAARLKVRTELGTPSMGVYQLAAEQEPGKDFSVVYKWYNDQHAR